MIKKKLLTGILCLIIFAFFVHPSPDVHAAPAPQPGSAICNGPDTMTILVLGIDNRTRVYTSGLADVIMVYRVDFQEPGVTVMGIPRDMWVEIPGIERGFGVTHYKLNSVYFYGGEYAPTSGERPEYGADLMKETLKVNWGLDIDHTAVVNMTIFKDMVNAVGGIMVQNPHPVYSKNQPGKVMFRAGGLYLDGQRAQLFARYRDPSNKLDRVDRQSILLNGIWEAVFTPAVVPRIPGLVAAFRGNMVTDLHLAQISQLLCLTSRLDESDIVYTRIPKDTIINRMTYFEPLDGYVFNWVEKEEGAIREIMTRFQEGNYPPSQGE